MYQKQKTRSYTYRVPVDDKKAIRKIHKLQQLNSGYDIHKLGKNDVPNYDAAHNWGFIFYESRELSSLENGKTGGTIPGLHEYRYSLDWKPMPHTTMLEMRHANDGGTRIRGEQYIGTHDPRLSNYVKVDFTVPWTPGELEDMFNGNSVPDKKNYHHEPPEISAEKALEQFNEMIHWAEQDAFEEMQEQLYEQMENCNHEHVVETVAHSGIQAYCEDCGKEWDEYAYSQEKSDLTIVGKL